MQHSEIIRTKYYGTSCNYSRNTIQEEPLHVSHFVE